MDLGPQHLRMIVAVSETGSIGKAAARLDLTQPAVSTMLRRVEKHLGVRLFVRSPSGVALTPIGAEVATRAGAVLACIDDLNTTLAGSRAGGAARPLLRLGAQACPALTLLGEHLGTLAPETQIQLRVDQGAGRIPPLLASGALDVGFVQEPVGHAAEEPAGVERCVLIDREPLFVGMSSRDPLAARSTVDLADLADRDWVDDPADDGPFPAYFREVCRGAGFQPRVRFWSGDWQISSSIVRTGRAVGIYQPTALPREGVVFRRLTGDPLAQRVVLMWRPEARPVALRLRDSLTRIYLGLVRSNDVYAAWWDAHPAAHPGLPALALARSGEG
ncbi:MULTISPECIES: LysR family transcriptional regulator [Actinomadura]|uniref:LysR substrate-binding domain-containing protein n=1 Tax=Actinomadura yumaensis TaxID=111807 RepID=A0ABW2CDN1_9ACTN|nr:LysR family transcriptional regulator [Actinomadura sp. J1-007]MWK38164.1 LysR family transcriptional regulator [Actinomadura sp. J1-007]